MLLFLDEVGLRSMRNDGCRAICKLFAEIQGSADIGLPTSHAFTKGIVKHSRMCVSRQIGADRLDIDEGLRSQLGFACRKINV